MRKKSCRYKSFPSPVRFYKKADHYWFALCFSIIRARLYGMGKHSRKFLNILASSDPEREIRIVTHATPILVFWVSPDGKVIDAEDGHHENPPGGDRSILSDPTHKGHLRGRAAYFDDKIYIVVYGDAQYDLSKKQQTLLRKTCEKILNTVKSKLPKNKQNDIESARFINEIGESSL